MKLYAPRYYSDFKCIAEKCKNNCCVGWEIDVDDDTLKKYRCLTQPYAKDIITSIDMADYPHFKLTSSKRCPHLNDKGLCEIILNLGEDCLCEICQEHPRFYTDTNHGKEVGIGLACEEACRIILNSDDYDKIIPIGEIPGNITRCKNNVLSYRRWLYKLLKEEDIILDIKIGMIMDYFDLWVDDNWIKTIMSQIEYLDDGHKELFCNPHEIKYVSKEYDDILCRIYAYLIFRHCSGARTNNEFMTELSFATFCTLFIMSISDLSNIFDIARIFSEEIEYSEDNCEKIKNILDDPFTYFEDSI